MAIVISLITKRQLERFESADALSAIVRDDKDRLQRRVMEQEKLYREREVRLHQMEEEAEIARRIKAFNKSRNEED